MRFYTRECFKVAVMTDKIIFLIDPEGDSIDLVCEEKITANSSTVQKTRDREIIREKKRKGERKTERVSGQERQREKK